MADAAVAVAALLDGARRPLLRAIVRVEPARRVFVVRERRVLAGALVAVATSFAVAAWQPLIALWLGAALLGVPHVVSGLRHVAVRERLRAPTRLFVALAIVVGVVELCGSGTRVADGAVRAYVLLFAAAILVELRGRAVVSAAVVALAALGLVAPRLTLIALAHLHGLGAVAWFARRARARGVVVWPFVAAVCVVFVAGTLGAFDALWPSQLWAPRSAAASIVAEAAGSTVDGALLHRALFLYAFGQALHFAIWLRLVPDLELRVRDAAQLPPRARPLRSRLRPRRAAAPSPHCLAAALAHRLGRRRRARLNSALYLFPRRPRGRGAGSNQALARSRAHAA